MSSARCCFVFTHDSVGVGEDGPTHQPVEHLASLRSLPDLQVIRPADANEVIAAWPIILNHDGPTALILSRQAVEVVTDGSAVERGAAEIYRSPPQSHGTESNLQPQVVLVASGSEVALCVAAVGELEGHGIRSSVVSMPSWDRFARQEDVYRHSLLPDGVPVVSVEAATTFGWDRYADRCIGIDRFGASAPGAEVMERLGLSVGNICATVLELLQD
jgi:transketolase